MPLVVDSFVLGPFRSNCYVVRAERGAAEAAVIDPGDDPSGLRLDLARMGARAAGILASAVNSALQRRLTAMSTTSRESPRSRTARAPKSGRRPAKSKLSATA